MKIAIASGKGGTGKTTVAVNLACVLAENDRHVQYLDCDVEAPNGHLFLQPRIEATETVGIPVPVIDKTKCTECGRCAEACRYHAIAAIGKPLVFPELCHGCGGCMRVCPEGAIREQDRPVGVVETGRAGPVAVVQGRLNIGEPMAPPIIRAVKAKMTDTGVAILDAPPGTACPMVTTIRGADFVLLVTEPTPFGLHDLHLAVETVRQLRIPHGVAVNRADGDPCVADFCRANGLPMMLEIPDDRRVAEAYSRGELAARALPDWKARLEQLWDAVVRTRNQ